MLVYTPLGPYIPVYTQESSLRCLPRNGAWPSPAVTMSSSWIGDPSRDGARRLFASRSSGSGESPLPNAVKFLCRWLRACFRTSSVLAGESHLPGVGGVAQPLLAPLRAAIRPISLKPRALGSTLCDLPNRTLRLRPPTSSLPLSRPTLLSLLCAFGCIIRKCRIINRATIQIDRGRTVLSTRYTWRRSWRPDTVWIVCIELFIRVENIRVSRG